MNTTNSILSILTSDNNGQSIGLLDGIESPEYETDHSGARGPSNQVKTAVE